MNGSSWFAGFARWVGRITAHPGTFVLAGLVITVWAVSGPVFGFSDTWQLVINTGTTIVTFLMVFLIQNTQNRDTAAMHLKLDELLRAVEGAHNTLIDLEDDTEGNLEEIKARYQEVAEKAKEGVREAFITGTPPISDLPSREEVPEKTEAVNGGMDEMVEAADIDAGWNGKHDEELEKPNEGTDKDHTRAA